MGFSFFFFWIKVFQTKTPVHNNENVVNAGEPLDSCYRLWSNCRLMPLSLSILGHAVYQTKTVSLIRALIRTERAATCVCQFDKATFLDYELVFLQTL